MGGLEDDLADLKKQLSSVRKESGGSSSDSPKKKGSRGGADGDQDDDLNEVRTKPEVLEREAQESRKKLGELESQLRSTKRELQELRAEYDKITKGGIKAGTSQFNAEKLLREENEKVRV